MLWSVIVLLAANAAANAMTISTTNNKTLDWLLAHGFLNATNENVFTDLHGGIKDMQETMGFNSTGYLTETQIKLLEQPLCITKRIDPKVFVAFWGKKALTWSYYPPYDSLFPISNDDMRAIINHAFRVWTQELDLKITEKEPYDDNNPDLKLRFYLGNHSRFMPMCKNGNSFDGPGGILGHGFYPEVGEIHFDLSERWGIWGDTFHENDHIDMFSVVFHEIGHALGLPHSPFHLNTIMRAFYNTPTAHYTKFQIHPLDALAIHRLYPGKDKSPNIAPWDNTTTKFWNPPRVPVYTPRYNPQPRFPYRPQPRFPYRPKPRYPIPTPRRRMYSTPKHLQSYFDAEFSVDNELVLIKNQKIWRLGYQGILPKYPLKLNEFFVQHQPLAIVDSLYQRYVDKYTIIFSNDLYYRYNRNLLIRGYPKKISNLLNGYNVRITKIIPMKGAEWLVFYISNTHLFLFNEYTNRVVYTLNIENDSIDNDVTNLVLSYKDDAASLKNNQTNSANMANSIISLILSGITMIVLLTL